MVIHVLVVVTFRSILPEIHSLPFKGIQKQLEQYSCLHLMPIYLPDSFLMCSSFCLYCHTSSFWIGYIIIICILYGCHNELPKQTYDILSITSSSPHICSLHIWNARKTCPFHFGLCMDNDDDITNLIKRITQPMASLCAQGIITPALAPMLRTFKGLNSYRVPIYCTRVMRDNCGQNALSKGIRPRWDLNLWPSDYESRARTSTPQCSHRPQWMSCRKCAVY